ncbi:DUF6326 family protein [Stakelama tenebrarum]|uniref:DoxX family protein n=1 Tax=Stakelama tenebrarum TaxID=2711215 RepID=A0A6G6Y7M6_9SPHN|nr:DUF6326 family protein [Sphingosinithalassobacter tenebrarum]QIG80576.1 hypothetical protein G5C33_12830 [Sphingosinithalassobacter tenebrarum]
MTDLPIPLRVRIAALWATLMSLYIYNDYFKLYRPGVLGEMAAGRMGPLGPADATVLIIVSVMLAIPACMIALSVLLPPVASRWLSVVVALLYTAIEALAFVGAYPAYQIIVALELLTTLTILWMALRWPRPDAT